MIHAPTKLLEVISKAERKANGIHYTPPSLAQYLARQLAQQYLSANPSPDSLTVLDPACGDGELLHALVMSFPNSLRPRTRVIGYDTSANAVAATENRLSALNLLSVDVRCRDFLSTAPEGHDSSQLGFGFGRTLVTVPEVQAVDLIISNPPYVRTQVLGAQQARVLARRFNLSGRIDLYHAFVIAMTNALRAGGGLGLLTSNRFISTQAGASLRDWFIREFWLAQLIDLGDTRLFEAAVLPAIIIAEKATTDSKQSQCHFVRIYELPNTEITATSCESIFDALSQKCTGTVAVGKQRFKVEIGSLRAGEDQSTPWILTSASTDKWIETINKRKAGIFADFSKVSVGVKTTADKVFIRDDWAAMSTDLVPEDSLLHRLVTHHAAERWVVTKENEPTRKVLYPYIEVDGRRQPISLKDFPRATCYLESHRKKLESRSYLVDAGREWYEIWVPHSPSDWKKPKIAFPDISTENTFFLTRPGWIVNGDCYWIALKPAIPESNLLAMLAIANSTFIAHYYDVMFHNKLYAGRRRFMSQYVKNFPMPTEKFTLPLTDVARKLLDAKIAYDRATVSRLEEEADALVWESFGLVKEI